jgi:multiple sugar transport system substrate-binding protein
MSPEHLLGKVERLLLACTILFLSGCVKATPTPEPVTIAFRISSGESEYYTSLIEAFSQVHPHITVELVDPQGGQADVYIGSPLLEDQPEGIDLDPFVEQDESFDLDDFYPGTANAFIHEGKRLAVPIRVDALVMYYNLDLFDRYGVAYPSADWTWDEFLDAAAAIRDPGPDVFGYADPSSYVLLAWLSIYQHGGRLFDDLDNVTRGVFDDPLAIEALVWVARLIHEYNIAPTPEQAREAFGPGDEAVVQGIIQDKVAMWPMWFSQRNELIGGDKRLGIVPLPQDAQSFTVGMPEGLYISAQTEHPEACWQWVSYLSEQPPQTRIPVRRSIAESAEYTRQVGSQVATTARVAIESAYLISPKLVSITGDFGALFDQAVADIVQGRATPEQAMFRAQQEYDKGGQ